MMHVQSDYKAEKKIRIKLLGRWTEELFEKESVKERTEENLSRKVARILEVNLSTLFGKVGIYGMRYHGFQTKVEMVNN